MTHESKVQYLSTGKWGLVHTVTIIFLGWLLAFYMILMVIKYFKHAAYHPSIYSLTIYLKPNLLPSIHILPSFFLITNTSEDPWVSLPHAISSFHQLSCSNKMRSNCAWVLLQNNLWGWGVGKEEVREKK